MRVGEIIEVCVRGCDVKKRARWHECVCELLWVGGWVFGWVGFWVNGEVVMVRTRGWVSRGEAAWSCIGLYVWRHFVQGACEEGMMGQGGWCIGAERLHACDAQEFVSVCV